MTSSQPTIIKGFFPPHRFLSNFEPCTIVFEGMTFPSVEHAYQAAKSLDLSIRRYIANQPSPATAKRLGKAPSRGGVVVQRKDWGKIRLGIMEQLCQSKFQKGTELWQKLQETGDVYLEETNSWHDTFWGVCQCFNCGGEGSNELGKLLMRIRDEEKREPLPT